MPNDITDTVTGESSFQQRKLTDPWAEVDDADQELTNAHAVAIIEAYLYRTVPVNEAQYIKSREIAHATGLSTKLVATLIQTVDAVSDRVHIAKWAYTSATTWKVETTDV